MGCSLDRVRIFQNVAKKDGVIWVLSIPLERERERGGERGGERERERGGERGREQSSIMKMKIKTDRQQGDPESC